MTSGPRQRTTKQIFIESRTYSIIDTNNPVYNYSRPTTTGLVSAIENGAGMVCGLHTGRISITVETWDEPPPLELELWEDVAEVPLTWTYPQMELWGAGEEGFMIFSTGEAPGSYRLRVSVKNRIAREVEKEGDRFEEHLVQFWPADFAGDVLHKGASEHGAWWRSRSPRGGDRRRPRP